MNQLKDDRIKDARAVNELKYKLTAVAFVRPVATTIVTIADQAC